MMWRFDMKKILVIQQKMIGDVLVSSLLCEHLKEHFPNSKIHYVVNTNTVAVVENNPCIDQIIIFKPEYRTSKLAFLRFLRSISKEKYDVVIDIYGKLESNLITLFSKARIKIAYAKGYSSLIYTDTVTLQPRTPGKTGITVSDRLGLLAPLIPSGLKIEKEPKITLTADEIIDAKLFLEAQHVDMSRTILMIGILGSHETKTYPLHQMAEVIDAIARKIDGTLLFNYIPSQHAEAKKLYELCSETTRTKIPFDTFAPSLRKFLGLLYHCKALVGNEGGAVNMAKALGIPTFSIYSPWINKMAWHTFERDSNVAVHLSDYQPELIRAKPKAVLKNESPELYKEFKFGLFKNTLNSFLENHAITNK